jgi:hypothetical protein
MHKLTLAACLPRDHFSGIVGGKSGDRGARLTGMLPAVQARYVVFEAAHTVAGISGVALGTWTKAEREDLLHCYETTTKALQQLKTLISESQPDGVRDVCPYCCIGGPRQFDHYLPKEKFPEYSVHSYNLVPCCGVCNGKKSYIWLQPNNTRTFINFYLDSLPAAPMLDVTVQWSVKNGKLVPVSTFQLVCPAGFGVAEFQLVSTHFQKLGLLARYKDQAHTEFLAIRNSALSREAKTVEVLRQFLKNFIKNWEQTLGPLNWRISLYRALIEHTPFLQSCLKP